MKTIPSIKALPIIGNLRQLLQHNNFLDFYTHYWKELGDIYKVKVFGQEMVVVAHPDGIEHILSTNRDNYIKGSAYDAIRLLVGDGLLTLEGHA